VYRREHRLPWLGYRQESILRLCWQRGEREFSEAWWALRSGRIGDACGIAEGRLVPSDEKGRPAQTLRDALRVLPDVPF
jgi:hypothetical protein